MPNKISNRPQKVPQKKARVEMEKTAHRHGSGYPDLNEEHKQDTKKSRIFYCSADCCRQTPASSRLLSTEQAQKKNGDGYSALNCVGRQSHEKKQKADDQVISRGSA